MSLTVVEIGLATYLTGSSGLPCTMMVFPVAQRGGNVSSPP